MNTSGVVWPWSHNGMWNVLCCHKMYLGLDLYCISLYVSLPFSVDFHVKTSNKWYTLYLCTWYCIHHTARKCTFLKLGEILTETWETSETSPEIGGDDISFWSRQFCSNKVLVSCLFPFSVQIYIVIDHLH